jgi:nitrogen regulatory protein P-II 1
MLGYVEATGPALERIQLERVACGASAAARRDGACLGVGGLTVTEVRGSGNETDRTEHHLEAEHTTDLVPKAVVEVVVADDVVAAAIATICQMARTELAGDGYVFVLPVSATIRIRTGEVGEEDLC